MDAFLWVHTVSQLTITGLRSVSQYVVDLRNKKFLMQVLPQTYSCLWRDDPHTDCVTVFSLHIHTYSKSRACYWHCPSTSMQVACRRLANHCPTYGHVMCVQTCRTSTTLTGHLKCMHNVPHSLCYLLKCNVSANFAIVSVLLTKILPQSRSYLCILNTISGCATTTVHLQNTLSPE